MRAIACSALAILLSSGASARAQQIDEESRERQMGSLEEMRDRAAGRKNGRFPGTAEDERHTGGYFRVDALGLGRVSTSFLSPYGDTTMSGLGGAAGLHFGEAFQRGVILGVHLYAAGAMDPKLSAPGVSGTAKNTTVLLIGAGPELTFYLPANFYVTSSFLFTQVRIDADGNTGETEAGLGANFALGKEWWVSRRWGVGVAGHLAFSSNKDKGGDYAPTLRTTSLGVAMSATYN